MKKRDDIDRTHPRGARSSCRETAFAVLAGLSLLTVFVLQPFVLRTL